MFIIGLVVVDLVFIGGCVDLEFVVGKIVGGG